MIKLAIFLALAALVYSSPVEIKNKFDTLAETCMLENGIIGESRQSMALRVGSGNLSSNEKCYFKCLMKGLHMMDALGNFTPREGMQFVTGQVGTQLTENQIQTDLNLLRDCSFPDIEDQCEKAVSITNCISGVRAQLSK